MQSRLIKTRISTSGCTISFLDPADPQRYVETRGEVVAFELYETLDFVNLLARKYTGADFQHGHAGERRFKLTIRVDAWTGQAR